MITLNDQIVAAIDLWDPKITTKSSDIIDGINRYWRDSTSQYETSLTVVKAARKCFLKPEMMELWHGALESQAVRLDGLLNGTLGKVKSSFDANIKLSSAILKTSLATTTALYNQLSKDCQSTVGELISEAASIFDDIWPITAEKIQLAQKTFSKHTAPKHLLNYVLQASSFDFSVSTYLSMRRIVAYILCANPRSDHKNEFWMPFSGKDEEDQEHKMGRCIPFRIRNVDAPMKGCFIDPISIGALAIDKEFVTATRLASRLSLQFCKPNSRALRIELPANDLPHILGGPSGGGLLAVAFRLTGEGKTLASYKSASGELLVSTHELAKSESEPLSWDLVSIGPIGATLPKLRSMFQTTHIQGVALAVENYAEWKGAKEKPTPQLVSTLDDLYQYLSKQGANDRLLKKYCAQVSDQWKKLKLENASSRDSSHRLNTYVPQRLRIENYLGAEPEIDVKPLNTPEPFVFLEQPSQERKTDESLIKLLALSFRNDHGSLEEILNDKELPLPKGKDILLYDRAGAGKSVATIRIAHLLSNKRSRKVIFDHSHPMLVVRLEGRWKGKSNLLVPLRQMLVEHAIGILAGARSRRSEYVRMVDHTIIWQRVVIIIDGFDQFSTDERAHIVTEMNSEDGRRCRWIVASRQHTIDELFPSDTSDRWLRVRLEPFNFEEQDKYFELAGIQDWRDVVDVSSMNELLGSPIVLRRIADLITSSKVDNDPSISAKKLFIDSDSQLGIVTMRRSLQEALKSSAFRSTPIVHESTSFHTDLLERVLSTIAFQCMIEERYDARVPQVEIAELEQRCLRRFLLDTNRELVEKQSLLSQGDLQSKHLVTGDVFLLQKKREQLFQDWNEAVRLLYTIQLNHRDWVEHADHQGLAFQSLKAMELYAARYLTRYATQEDIFGIPGAPEGLPCALDHISDDHWFETWRLAIEMPRRPLTDQEIDRNGVANDATMSRTLSALFQMPKQGVRPTELLFRCWHLFEPDEFRLREMIHASTNGERMHGFQIEETDGIEMLMRIGESLLLPNAKEVVGQFRSTDRSLPNLVLQMTARNQLPDDASQVEDHLLAWRSKTPREKAATFLRCPPSNSDSSVDSSAVSGTTEAAFFLQSAPVTRYMYRLFDSNFESSKALVHYPERMSIGRVLRKFASNPNDESDVDGYPVVGASFYDAFVFSKWLGSEFSIPNPEQWLLAATNGRTTPFANGEEISADFANYHESKLGRAVPCGDTRYPPSQWGLHDINGNVMAWLLPQSSSEGFEATLAGGSFQSLQNECRSARIRTRVSRWHRDARIGIRLASLKPSLAGWIEASIG